MTEIEIYGKCVQLGMTPAGAAGATANILAESAGNPRNVEDRSCINDDRYTEMVDNRTYANFTTDAYGYGLCQWTSRNRKKELLDYAQGHGVSIGDASMQFQFMAREMRSSYTYVWNVLTHTTDPYEAGYVMCKFYEIPANTEAQSQYRGNQARGIYERCSGMTPAVDSGKDTDVPAKKSEYWPPRMIDKGMDGPDVLLAQASLLCQGYTIGDTLGVFGASTEEAVKKLQKAHGKSVDGVIGHGETWPLLRW